MKKLAISTFLCLSLSCTLVAQEGIIYEVEPTVGYNSFDSASKMESDITYGIRATAYMNEFYGYRIGYERADDIKYDVPITTPDSKKRTDMQRISTALLISGEEEYNVIPYLFAGLGYEFLSNETNSDVSQAYIDGGLGFKYMFLNNLNMNIEAKILKKFDTSDMDFGVNFGFGYMLGGSLSSDKYESDDFNDVLKNKHSENSTLEDVKKKGIETTELSENELNTVSEKKAENVINNAKVIKESISKVSQVEIIEDDFKRVKDEPFIIKNNSDKQYYVQMAAWFKGVYKKLPATLEKNGYDYEIKDVIRKNQDAKIVIIGPYANYTEAKTARIDLIKIRNDAFVTKI